MIPTMTSSNSATPRRSLTQTDQGASLAVARECHQVGVMETLADLDAFAERRVRRVILPLADVSHRRGEQQVAVFRGVGLPVVDESLRARKPAGTLCELASWPAA